MRSVFLLVLLAACGDNVRPTRLELVAPMPVGGRDIAFDRDDVPVARSDDGVVRRLVANRWHVVGSGYRAIDLGSDNDGNVLVMSSIPRQLFRLDGAVLVEVGGIVIANVVHMPVQVPSGNIYVKELAGEERSFVLTAGSTTWAPTPPMFFSRPVRAYDGTLYATVAAGVQRFEVDGTRTIAVECAVLGKQTCTPLVLGGADGGRIYLGDANEPEAIVVADTGTVDRIELPGALVPVRLASGSGITVVLAKRDELDPADERYFLFAIVDDRLEIVDSVVDPPAKDTRLAIDHAGNVWVATKSLSKVLP